MQIANKIEGRTQNREVAASYGNNKIRQFALAEAEQYTRSLQLLDNLARTYGFKYVCFWQPLAILENNLTPEEAACDLRINDQRLKELFTHVSDSLRQRPPANWVDLTNTFDGRTKSAYFDFCHLTEEGSARVAERIASTLQQMFFQPPQKPGTPTNS